MKNCGTQKKKYFGFETHETTALFTILTFLVLRAKSINILW